MRSRGHGVGRSTSDKDPSRAGHSARSCVSTGRDGGGGGGTGLVGRGWVDRLVRRGAWWLSPRRRLARVVGGRARLMRVGRVDGRVHRVRRRRASSPGHLALDNVRWARVAFRRSAARPRSKGILAETHRGSRILPLPGQRSEDLELSLLAGRRGRSGGRSRTGRGRQGRVGRRSTSVWVRRREGR